MIVLDSAERRIVAWVDPDNRLPIASQRAFAAPTPDSTRPDSSTRGIPRLSLALALKDTTIGARSAGASNVIVLTIRNSGTGTALGVEPYAVITPESGATGQVVWAPLIASSPPAAPRHAK
ncbi:MAG: hypothetical protein U0163_12555 [Gemmatimonadaceae bacterium]